MPYVTQLPGLATSIIQAFLHSFQVSGHLMALISNEWNRDFSWVPKEENGEETYGSPEYFSGAWNYCSSLSIITEKNPLWVVTTWGLNCSCALDVRPMLLDQGILSNSWHQRKYGSICLKERWIYKCYVRRRLSPPPFYFLSFCTTTRRPADKQTALPTDGPANVRLIPFAFFSTLWLHPFTCQWPAAEDNFEARELAPVNMHWHHTKPSKSKLQGVTQHFLACYFFGQIFESPMTTKPIINNGVVTNLPFVMLALGQPKQISSCLIRQEVRRSSCGWTQCKNK